MASGDAGPTYPLSGPDGRTAAESDANNYTAVLSDPANVPGLVHLVVPADFVETHSELLEPFRSHLPQPTRLK